ncbi:MAG TPA: VOC family protein [Nevskiaceae bacterium]|nr:VOC family protein [Nevskiaceae bacterium]
MQIQPYLFFEGRCEEAINHYKKAIGAEPQFLMRNKEAPEPGHADRLGPGAADKIMHASFKVGDTVVMASDGMCSGKPNFGGISLSIEADTEAQAKKLFDGLAEGGQVQQPLIKTFFSPAFGMVADRFGVSWMVVVKTQ